MDLFARKIIDKGLNDCYNGNISFGVLNVEGNLVHGFIGSCGPFFVQKTEIEKKEGSSIEHATTKESKKGEVR